MTLDEYDEFCGSLMATTTVIQWGESHVWKVGGKVFAIGLQLDEGSADDQAAVTFKCDPDDFEFLTQLEGVRPAPYLASRGFSWAQHFESPGLDDDMLMEHIEDSHRIVGEGLSKKKQRELGLLVD